jgi:uncharacterized membrane protein
MTTKTAAILVFILFGCALCASLLVYPSLPARMPIHFNLEGQANGWAGKTSGCLGPLLIQLLLLVMVLAGDWISPARFKVSEFRSSFNYIMVIASALLVYVYGLMLAAALYPGRLQGRWGVGGLFLFLAWMGNMLGKTRRNFWVGIRTPWTLASDAVWIATHRLAARIFVIVGILGALGAATHFPAVIYLALLAIAILVPVLYSFWISKKLEKSPSPYKE